MGLLCRPNQFQPPKRKPLLVIEVVHFPQRCHFRTLEDDVLPQNSNVLTAKCFGNILKSESLFFLNRPKGNKVGSLPLCDAGPLNESSRSSSAYFHWKNHYRDQQQPSKLTLCLTPVSSLSCHHYTKI